VRGLGAKSPTRKPALPKIKDKFWRKRLRSAEFAVCRQILGAKPAGRCGAHPKK